MRKLWKDHWVWWSYFYALILILYVGVITIAIIREKEKFYSFLSFSLSEQFPFLILALVPLFMFILVLSHRLSSITKNGIYIGTVSRDDHIENPKLHLRKFLSWEKIKRLKVIKKKTKRSYGIMDFVSTLQVKPKQGNVQECYINDISGFSKALKSVGKHSLLVSDSYVGKSTTDIPLEELFNTKSKYFKIFIRILISSLVVVGIYMFLRFVFGI